MFEDPRLLIAGVAGLLSIIILIVGIISMRRQTSEEIEERLDRYTDFEPIVEFSEDDVSSSSASQGSQLTQAVDGLLLQRGIGQKYRESLAKADLKITVAEYMALHVISTIGFFILGFFLIFRNNLVVSLIAGVVGYFAPRIYVNRKQNQRLINFEAQLPDTISLWVNSLRSGYSVLQAMEAIAKESPDPSASEFRRVVQEVQLGIAMEDALDHMLKRMVSDDLDLIVTAVNIQREVGGNLAEILEVIGHTVRERIKLKGEIRVLTSQGRYTGYLISFLPIILALFLLSINPKYMGGLFENRMCGWPMLAIGLGLIGIGNAVIQRIVDIQY